MMDDLISRAATLYPYKPEMYTKIPGDPRGVD